jgi:hypothetical protein
MSEEIERSSAPLSEPTDVRFSMRALLIVTAVVAVLAAVMGPFVRQLPPDAQVRLLGVWGGWLLAVIILTGFQARQRYRAERLAGRTLLRMKLREEQTVSYERLQGSRSVFWTIVGVLVMLFFASQAAISLAGGVVPTVMIIGTLGTLSIWSTIRAVMLLWWRNTIRFCEAGLQWDRHLMLWEYVLERRWDESDAKVLIVQGIDQRNLDSILKIAVPADERAAVESLLESKLSKSTSVPRGPMMREHGSIPLSIAVRNPNLFKYVDTILRFICLYIGGMVLFISSFGGPREFRRAMLVFLIGAVVLSTVRWWFAGNRAGVPLVRLEIRLDWRRVFVFAVVAAICFYVGNSWGWTSVWLAYAAGAGFGWAIGVLVGSYFQRPVDFRANGAVMPGILYWPWPDVRLMSWDREQSGRLVLQRGWRRIVAIVPPEQREAVEAVLKEKLRADVTR